MGAAVLSALPGQGPVRRLPRRAGPLSHWAKSLIIAGKCLKIQVSSPHPQSYKALWNQGFWLGFQPWNESALPFLASLVRFLGLEGPKHWPNGRLSIELPIEIEGLSLSLYLFG
jgi:hypothetical protein